MNGVFLEGHNDPHVGLRSQVLGGANVLRDPEFVDLRTDAAGLTQLVDHDLPVALALSGLAVVRFSDALSNEEFLRLGRALGSPMRETDPAVQEFTEEEVILNLRSRYGHTDDPSLQPFSSGFITLHTESSRRRAADQPRYIVLMCCDPGDEATGSRTVLVSMAEIGRSLSDADVDLLTHTRYRSNTDGPPILRILEGRCVFSFRDFHREPLAWTFTGAETSADRINQAIGSMLAAIYRPETAMGIRWSSGILAVIDNARWFHGRTAGDRELEAAARPRHLKRLRIT